jgi:hypothetical protein
MDSIEFPTKFFSMARMKYVGLTLVLFALVSLIMKPSQADLEASAIDKSPVVSLDEKATYQHHLDNQFASIGQTTAGKPLQPVEECWPEPSYYRFDQLKASNPSLKNADQSVSKKPLLISEDASRVHSLNGILFEAPTALLTDSAHQEQVLDTLEIVEKPSSEPAYFCLILDAASSYEGDASHQSRVLDTPETIEKPTPELPYFSLFLEAAASQGNPQLQTGPLDTPETEKAPTSKSKYFSLLLEAATSQENPPFQTGALDTPETKKAPNSKPNYFSLLLEAATSQKDPPFQTGALDTPESEKDPISKPTYFGLLLAAAASQGNPPLKTGPLDTPETKKAPNSKPTYFSLLLEAAASSQEEPPNRVVVKECQQISEKHPSEPSFRPVLLETVAAYGMNDMIPSKKKGKRVRTESSLSELPFHNIILEAAVKYQVDPALIKAVIMAESSYNPKAVSPRGARGLMQLMPRTAESLGVKDIFDPFHNINGGVKYLRRLLDRFKGDVELALAAYNAGSRYVRKYKGVPPFKATRLYIKKVIKYLDIYRKELMEIPGVA